MCKWVSFCGYVVHTRLNFVCVFWKYKALHVVWISLFWITMLPNSLLFKTYSWWVGVYT